MQVLAAGNWHRAWRYAFLASLLALFTVAYFSDHSAEAPEWYHDWRRNHPWNELLWPGLVLATSIGYLIAMRLDPVVDDERAARWFRAIATPIIALFDLVLIGLMLLYGNH